MVMMIVSLIALILSDNKSETYSSPLFLEAIVIVFLSVLDMASISFLGSKAHDELGMHW